MQPTTAIAAKPYSQWVTFPDGAHPRSREAAISATRRKAYRPGALAKSAVRALPGHPHNRAESANTLRDRQSKLHPSTSNSLRSLRGPGTPDLRRPSRSPAKPKARAHKGTSAEQNASQATRRTRSMDRLEGNLLDLASHGACRKSDGRVRDDGGTQLARLAPINQP